VAIATENWNQSHGNLQFTFLIF